ncbi:MAG: M42 family metallopeptidase, partial [Cellulosilyticaceae bacterium]
MEANKEYVMAIAKEILGCDSPSGYCHEVMALIEQKVKDYGYAFEYTQKGCGIITVPGKESGRVIGLSAHVDTLGAMVRSITGSGTLKFTQVGGPILATLDGEYCKVRTRDGRTYTGTFLSTSPSSHVYEDAATKARDAKGMEVRLDEEVKSKEDVQNLGISNGDYIFIDPKTTVTESGFLKSRFIDDKASVAILLTLLHTLSTEKTVPTHTLKILLSTYEEVGHGASYIPEDITEMIAVDMGCIGEDLSCTEYQVSICAKDSAGPYDYHMTSELIELAKTNNLDYAVDIYPMYGSDVGAALRGGNNIKGALIGPGVHASHGMERT